MPDHSVRPAATAAPATRSLLARRCRVRANAYPEGLGLASEFGGIERPRRAGRCAMIATAAGRFPHPRPHALAVLDVCFGSDRMPLKFHRYSRRTSAGWRHGSTRAASQHGSHRPGSFWTYLGSGSAARTVGRSHTPGRGGVRRSRLTGPVRRASASPAVPHRKLERFPERACDRGLADAAFAAI